MVARAFSLQYPSNRSQNCTVLGIEDYHGVGGIDQPQDVRRQHQANRAPQNAVPYAGMPIAKQPSSRHNGDNPKKRMIAHRFGKAEGEGMEPSAAHPASGTGDAHDMLDGAGDPKRKEQ